ncbi:MAG: hypothetical protein CVU46_02605 [Chloroflexi bacterium HGW-Chloroflexi-8]|nr:MAG: hypothetical protein CVU46_02605 [Chloroflexi bacterium HGW-Chloroflexi-8]
MKVLVIGAGVLGSLVACRFQESGQQVTVFARNERYEQIKTNGLDLVEFETDIRSVVRVDVTDRIEKDDFYDLAVVLVRKNQLKDLLPQLAVNKKIPTFLFMMNNAEGPEDLIRWLGRERVLLGFPGAGGKRSANGRVTYRIVSSRVQATQLGELDGTISPRLKQIAEVFRKAGFSIQIQNNMVAWLKTHVALVSPVANAIYLAGCDLSRLADTQDGLIMMIRAIREGFHVLNHLDIPITPKWFSRILLIPESVWITILRIGLKSPKSELVLAEHARSARDEMRQLALEFQRLAIQSKVPTPNIDNLMRYVDINLEPLPQGSRTIKVSRRDWVPVLIAALIVSLGIANCLRIKSIHRKQNFD